MFDTERATFRVWRIFWVLAAAGTVAFAGWKGLNWSGSFLFGAALSAASLWSIQRMVNAVGRPASPRPSYTKSVLLGARYLLAGLIVYVMMRAFNLEVTAILCGLLVAATAAILEILYELIHGT